MGDPSVTWRSARYDRRCTHLNSYLQLWLAGVQVDEDKEAKKVAAARDMLEGRRQHFAEGEDDPFEGMSPQQIQQVMDSQRAALDAQRESERQAQREASASDDPFDVRLRLRFTCAASGTAMQTPGIACLQWCMWALLCC